MWLSLSSSAWSGFRGGANSLARDEVGPPPPGYVATVQGSGITVLKPPRALPCLATPQGVRRPRIWLGVRFGRGSENVHNVTASAFAPTGTKSTGKVFSPRPGWHYVSLHLRRPHEHAAPDETCGDGTWTLTYTIKSKAHPAVRHTRHFSFDVPAPSAGR